MVQAITYYTTSTGGEQPVSTANPLPVTLSGGGGTTATNITQVGGTTIAAGTSTPAASMPVTQAISSSFFNFAGTGPGTTAGSAVALPSNAITTGAFLQNTGTNTLYVGNNNAITANAGVSTSGYEIVANGQLPLFGNNTNLTYIIGSTTYAVIGS